MLEAYLDVVSVAMGKKRMSGIVFVLSTSRTRHVDVNAYTAHIKSSISRRGSMRCDHKRE